VSEFAELRGVGSENLIYIKEDLIIPHVSCRVVCAVSKHQQPNLLAPPSSTILSTI
jgi:hypothetical protein